MDLSGLQYSGGDNLMSWRRVPERCGLAPAESRFAIVWSEHNRGGIRSLLDYLLDEWGDPFLPDWCFDTLEEAVQFVSAEPDLIDSTS